jgi:hypothetical protein
MSAASAPTSEISPDRTYSVAALFHELDGRRFSQYDVLIDAILTLMNEHLADMPIGYGYADALALAQERDWLAVGADGCSVTITAPAAAG